MSGLRVMYIDLNAYFASVEQQLQPGLRGRPIGIAPLEGTDRTCCIAVSYEARAYGVRTGTGVREARRLCPDITIVPARPAVYVRVHHQVREAIDRCAAVHAHHSIDEFSCHLMGAEREPGRAHEIACNIKASIHQRIGQAVRCSIGVAPNTLLAKIASNMQKPDGLTIVTQEQLPGALHRLELTDLTGIAEQTAMRLRAHNIRTVEELCAASRQQLRNAWGSVVGEYWWHWLRGDDVSSPKTRRQTVGHQHVLAPKFRTFEGARAVAIRLAHKAAARLRNEGFHTSEVRLAVRCEAPRNADGTRGKGPSFGDACACEATNRTQRIVDLTTAMWSRLPPTCTPMQVGITLTKLEADGNITRSLFEQSNREEDLGPVIDKINSTFGHAAVYLGSMHGAQKSAPRRISFSTVPLFDTRSPSISESNGFLREISSFSQFKRTSWQRISRMVRFAV